MNGWGTYRKLLETSHSRTQLQCSKCRASPLNVLPVIEDRQIHMQNKCFIVRVQSMPHFIFQLVHTLIVILRRVQRNQTVTHTPYIEEEQTKQLLKEKVQRTNNDLQNNPIILKRTNGVCGEGSSMLNPPSQIF